MKLSERLQNWLKHPGNTQTSLAAGTGISQGAINNYIKGRIPKPDELCKLADFFNCSTDELLGRDCRKYPEHQPHVMVAQDAPRKERARKLLNQIDELSRQLAELLDADEMKTKP